MTPPKLSTLQDYLALFIRRKWWILTPFLVLSSLVLVLVWLLPSAYVSETLIVIQPRDVPADFVKDLISGTTEQRLSAIEQRVLSRTNLLKILNEFEAGLTDFRSFDQDRKIQRLRDRIVVSFEGQRRGGERLPVAFFRISFRNPEPGLAQKIASRLGAMFKELDNNIRETQVFGTTEFMATELQKVADELQQSTTKLRELKERYRYELPEQLETNLRTLDRLSLQKKTNAETSDRYVSLKLNLERQLSQTPAVISRDSAEFRALARSAVSPLVEDFRKKERNYQELVARYTSKHPDVLRAKAELDRARREIPPEDLVEVQPSAAAQARQGVAPSTPNPVHQSLTMQLAEVKSEIGIRENERKWIDSEIARYSQRVQNTPRSEQEVVAVLRNNTDLTKQHQDLKDKLAQAKMSGSLESRQKGAQFETVDQANFPLVATKPNRWGILFTGLGMGLGIGIALALLVDSLNRKIWTEADLENLIGRPVLVEIPEIVTASDVIAGQRKRLVHVLLLVGLSGLYIGGLYFLYLYQSSVFRHLDPLVEKLMS